MRRPLFFPSLDMLFRLSVNCCFIKTISQLFTRYGPTLYVIKEKDLAKLYWWTPDVVHVALININQTIEGYIKTNKLKFKVNAFVFFFRF